MKILSLLSFYHSITSYFHCYVYCRKKSKYF